MIKKLRRCPFCGGKAHLHIHERYGVECDNCGMGLGCICDTEEEATKAWNRREPIDKIVEQLEELNEEEERFVNNHVFIQGIIEIVKSGGKE